MWDAAWRQRVWKPAIQQTWKSALHGQADTSCEISGLNDFVRRAIFDANPGVNRQTFVIRAGILPRRRFFCRAPYSPDRQQRVKRHGDRVGHHAHADGERHQPKVAEIDQRRPNAGGQQRVAREAKQVERDARLLNPLDVPLPVMFLAERVHQPCGLKITRGHEHARGGDDDGRQRPHGEHADENNVEQQTPLPAEFFGEGIAFEHEVRRRDPSAEKIHSPGKNQQQQQQAVFAAGEWKSDIHYFFLP